ncbi:GNAT family N-acetyltransferase [Vibrio sp. WJH972]
MNALHSVFHELKNIAANANHRLAYTIDSLDQALIDSCIQQLLLVFEENIVVELGGTVHGKHSILVEYNRGKGFLGRDIDLLLVDLSAGFDANSFNSLCGCLRGGGLLFFYNQSSLSSSYSDRWLLRSLAQLPSVSPLDLDSSTFSVAKNIPINSIGLSDRSNLTEQNSAISHIVKVASGRNSRPLLLTADRGRGKTSALGMSVAELFKSGHAHYIVICAPLFASVCNAFVHANLALRDSVLTKGRLEYGDCVFEFVPPDRLLDETPECDLMLIDEAAAIPVPILMDIAKRYSRVVFSSTQHGYEGCGRGFSLKFCSWIKSVYPNLRQVHLSQPIRWAKNDPLELWLESAFMFNSQVPMYEVNEFNFEQLTFSRVSKPRLYTDINLSNSLFSLLVHAHYQTSPNDWFSLLSNDAISVYVSTIDDVPVGCLLAVEEGPIANELVEDISLGRRRPPGHLVPVTLINQLGIDDVYNLTCLRIMRIAVHPSLTRCGIGRKLIEFTLKDTNTDYVGTSFGVTTGLHDFWTQCQFIPVKLGSRRDHVSGTYSMLYLHTPNFDFVNVLHQRFLATLPFIDSALFSSLPIELIRKLFTHNSRCLSPIVMPQRLLYRYCQGGSNFESVEPLLRYSFISYPSCNVHLSDLIIAKVIQLKSWKACASQFSLSGKSAAEAKFRSDVEKWLNYLQCKTSQD